MNLFEDSARKEMVEAHKRGIKLQILGNLSQLPVSLQRVLKRTLELTKNNQKMIVNIALNYGGRSELVRAIRELITSKVKPEEVTEELVNQNLDTAGLPDPDLIIRTSGEQRLSNFLPWQAVYSELYFPKVYWPDFDKKQLDLALKEFQKRKRRFGQ